MGKKGGIDQRTALANALNTTGVAKAAPAKKEAPKEEPANPGKGKGKRSKEPVEPEKTKADIEEEKRKHVENQARDKEDFYASESAKKIAAQKAADTAFTYVEDKDTRRPKQVSDISDYWKADIGFQPFLPTDNAGDNAGPEDEEVDPQDRLEYLQMLNEHLVKLLSLKFNAFWSQVIYDPQARRFLDTYLRFALRSHDSILDSGDGDAGGEDQVEAEADKVSREISRRVLSVYVRLSRAQETPHDFLTEGRLAIFYLEHNLFDVPKLIDICAIYGDSNRTAVTRIVHNVFRIQAYYKDEFESVVQHMLSSLHQCCEPLHQAAVPCSNADAELSAEECLTFLPDVLCCFNAIFCFFPEDCVEHIVKGPPARGSKGKAEAKAKVKEEDGGPPLVADLMVLLHEALMAMQQSRSGMDAVVSTTVRLLSRLLGLVLGFRMAPRRGVSAFEELLDWLRLHEDRGTLLTDLGKYGLESSAMEWLASGLVDDAQLDYLEQLCGPVLPAGERRRGRRPAAAPGGASAMAGTTAAASASAPSAAPKSIGVDASANDKAKIKEVREVVGNDYGEGFVLQCLLHFGGSVPAVVGAIYDGNLPPQISALPQGLTMSAAFNMASAANTAPSGLERTLSAEEKQKVLGQVGRQQDEAGAKVVAAQKAQAEGPVPPGRGEQNQEPSYALGNYDAVYGDSDVDDDTIPMASAMRVGGGGAGSESERESDEEGPDEDRQFGADRGKGGKVKGAKGGGKSGGGRAAGPVQGQTIGARRKEVNKAAVANHNRRAGADKKMRAGMGPQ